MSKLYFLRIWRLFIVLSLMIACYFLFKSTFLYIYPFLIASLIAFFIHPMVSTIERRLKIPRSLATLIVMCLSVALLMGSAFLIVTELFQGTLYLADRIPTYFESFISIIDTFVHTTIIPFYEKIISLFYSLTSSHQDTIIHYVDELNQYVATKGAALIQDFFIQIPAALVLLPNSATVIIFTVLATYFITNDWHFLKEKAYQFIPGLQILTRDIVVHFKKTMIDYVKAQLLLIFITGCLIYSGLLIFQIRHALTISFFIALVDLMPVIGTGIIFIPWILYLFITGDYALTISLIVLYMIIIITRQVLEPKILTAGVGLNPLVGLIILFVSLQTLGIAGFVLTPVFLIAVAVLNKSGLIHKIIGFIKG